MTKEELKTYLADKFTQLTFLESGRYDLFYGVAGDKLVETCTALRDDANLKFDYFCNRGGTDTGEQLEAVYQIASVYNKLRIDFKVMLLFRLA